MVPLGTMVAFRKSILIYLSCDKNTVALASVCFAISFWKWGCDEMILLIKGNVLVRLCILHEGDLWALCMNSQNLATACFKVLLDWGLLMAKGGMNEWLVETGTNTEYSIQKERGRERARKIFTRIQARWNKIVKHRLEITGRISPRTLQWLQMRQIQKNQRSPKYNQNKHTKKLQCTPVSCGSLTRWRSVQCSPHCEWTWIMQRKNTYGWNTHHYALFKSRRSECNM